MFIIHAVRARVMMTRNIIITIINITIKKATANDNKTYR